MGGAAAGKGGARDSSNASVENMDVSTSEQTWLHVNDSLPSVVLHD